MAYIYCTLVLHIVDEATHFNAATFLERQKSEATWKALLKCWSRVQLGPRGYLRVDQGSNLISKEFKGCAQAGGITVLDAPIESPSNMSHVEKYHAPLRRAYKGIRDSVSRSDTDRECLQLAVKEVKESIGPKGLCPTFVGIWRSISAGKEHACPYSATTN